MIKVFRTTAVIFLSFLLLSWGALGHKTIGTIAERHLNQQAKDAIKNLLDGSSLSEVSNWADEVRRDPEFKETAPWHYINLPLGLSKDQFEKQVLGMSQDNVYSALTKMEKQLKDPGTSREERINALKFIVHFVGDLHQPMHVSREEDQGGNKIQVNYDGKGTNLHALWDSRLLEHEGLNEEQLADRVDKATALQVKTWQNDPVIEWMWESYQISSTLYAEVDKMTNRTISDDYYRSHIPIVEDRLEKAGIRLAGLLNQVFSGAVVEKIKIKEKTKEDKSTSQAVKEISLSEVSSHLNETVKVCGKIYGEKSLSNMVLLDMGASYPNQLLTVVLRDEAKNNWKPSDKSAICVTGKLIDYKGKPEIVVSDLADISF